MSMAAVATRMAVQEGQPSSRVPFVRDSANSSGVVTSPLNVAIPSKAIVGDQLLVVIGTRTVATTIPAAPTGWTYVNSQRRATSGYIHTYTKIYASGDSSPVAFSTGMTASAAITAVMVAIAGADPSAPIDGSVGSQSSTAVTSTSITGLIPNTANTLELVMATMAIGSAGSDTFSFASPASLISESTVNAGGAQSITGIATMPTPAGGAASPAVAATSTAASSWANLHISIKAAP